MEFRPKILVVGHERSGTHFLMNTIGLNFGYLNEDWIDVDNIPQHYNPDNWVSFLAQVDHKNPLNIFKSHHDHRFFEPLFNRMADEWKIFYIWRMNQDDLFKSLCKHFNERDWNIGPKAKDYEELKYMQPSGACTRYDSVAHQTMLDRWLFHSTNWARIAKEHSNIHSLYYEDLNTHFDKMVRKIAFFLGEHLPAGIRRPEKTYNVII
jgi:hypothetical protein